LLNTEYVHFPFDKTFETARSEPLVVVHTSGTTGAPKPLIWTHDWVASFIQHNQQLPPPGFISQEQPTHGVELCSVAPPNHVRSAI
jgi:long-subunit acyl-CoA synthetase (AMP-forming)